MIFNTGSALLDAIVLAVVSKDRKGLMDIKSPRMSGRPLIFQSPPYIRC